MIDALERMQEFLRKYSDASQRFAGKIINSLVRLIIDEVGLHNLSRSC